MENRKNGNTGEASRADKTKEDGSAKKRDGKTVGQINPNSNDDDFNSDRYEVQNNTDQNRDTNDLFENDPESNQRDRTKTQDDSDYPNSRRNENRNNPVNNYPGANRNENRKDKDDEFDENLDKDDNEYL